MSDKKRILILTADAGFGHRSAAKALAAAIDEAHAADCEYEVVNALDHELVPAWLRDVQGDYDRIAREAAQLYKFTYDISDTGFASHLMENALRVLLYAAMRDIVLKFKPDAIVSTYPLYQAPLSALFTLRREWVPTVCVVTDLITVHQIWFTGESDLLIVPTEKVRDLARAAGFALEGIEVIGIPVHPRISGERRGKQELRSSLGLKTDVTTLLAVGSKRVSKLAESLDLLNHSGLPLQLIVVAGGDDDLFMELSRYEWHLGARLFNYVDDMPSLMAASDIVMAKAGGLIVTESLAAALPLVIVDMIPGQEEGNAEYVASGGAGVVASEPAAAQRALFHWLQDGGRGLCAASTAARELGRPRAAFDIVDRALALAAKGPRRREPLAAPAIAKLKELFERFGESVE